MLFKKKTKKEIQIFFIKKIDTLFSRYYATISVLKTNLFNIVLYFILEGSKEKMLIITKISKMDFGRIHTDFISLDS